MGVLPGDTDWVCSKCVARDDPPLSDSIPGELLLGEESDAPPGPGAAAPLPSYQDYWDQFDAVMDQYAMERSPSQPKTKGDGNCAVYGKLLTLDIICR